MTSRTRTLLAILTVAVVCSYWQVRRAESALRVERSALLGMLPKAPLLRGSLVPLRAQVDVLARSSYAANPEAKRLVIVSSDTCPACKAEQPRWEQLINRLRPEANIEILLVALGASELLEPIRWSLNERRAPWQLMRAKDVRAFTAFTGFAVTPTAAVLDSEYRVRLVAHRFTAELEELFIRELNSR